jgi:hypothetical protein
VTDEVTFGRIDRCRWRRPRIAAVGAASAVVLGAAILGASVVSAPGSSHDAAAGAAPARGLDARPATLAVEDDGALRTVPVTAGPV